MPDIGTAPPAMPGQPSMGASPVGAPSANPGKTANAIAQIREALKLLSMQLPNLEPGSDEYKGVYDAIGKLNKVAPPSAEVPGVQKTALRDLAQKAQQDGMMQSLMRGMGGAGGGASAAPPAAPPGAAAAAA